MKSIKDVNLERMKKCPQFNGCSAPYCPLDEDKDIRVRLKGEPKCKLSKRLRLAYGSTLPTKGLLPKEIAGLKSWTTKTPEVRHRTINRLAVYGKKSKFATREKTRDINTDSLITSCNKLRK